MRKYGIYIRGVARVKNPGGQVVMWHVVACRRRPAAPSDLPKSGRAAAPLASPLGASLSCNMENRAQTKKKEDMKSTITGFFKTTH